MSMDSLLEVRVVDGSVEEFLTSLGEVFVVHRGHDSGNTSYGVRTLYDVARAATEPDPDKRFASVSEFLTAWRSA